MTTAQREAILTADERIASLSVPMVEAWFARSPKLLALRWAIGILRRAAEAERDDLRPFGVYAPDADAAIAEAARLLEGAR